MRVAVPSKNRWCKPFCLAIAALLRINICKNLKVRPLQPGRCKDMTHASLRINRLLTQINGKRYLEIGVSRGETFRDVQCADKTGVDPRFAFDVRELECDSTRFATRTSDEFFAAEPLWPPYDVIFIDGLHIFEQVVRDFSNSLLRTHRQSAILIDDTLPNDIYSTLRDSSAALKFRKLAGSSDGSWHGDVFKIVFYIHDFYPALNYRTIVGSGNPQTLVWRAGKVSRKPVFDDLEKISRLNYFELQEYREILKESSEESALALCASETSS